MVYYNEKSYIYYRDIIEQYPNIRFDNIDGIIFLTNINDGNKVFHNIQYTLINDRVFIEQSYFDNNLKFILNNLSS